MQSRTIETPNTPWPQIGLLGRLPYTTLVSNAGGGVSRFGDMSVNRWRIDGTRDDHGQWCYLKNLSNGRVWSAAHQPVCANADSYQVTMANDSVSFVRRDGEIETTSHVVVVPGEAAEARRVVMSNLSDSPVEIEVTSYLEVVLAPHVSDRGHRAFGNLFVQTEWSLDKNSLFAMRRPRSKKDLAAWCGHTVAIDGTAARKVSCETDRARFIGRGRHVRNPVAMDKAGALSGTVGAVLDPVLALRTNVVIPARGSSTLIFTTFIAADRSDAERLAALYHDLGRADRAFALAAAVADGELSELGVSASDAARYQEIAGRLLYDVPIACETADASRSGSGTRSDLLRIGITGEWPVLLATMRGQNALASVSELISMHRYWRLKGLAADLVILTDDDMAAQVSSLVEATLLDLPRGVFVRSESKMSEASLNALHSIARMKTTCND